MPRVLRTSIICLVVYFLASNIRPLADTTTTAFKASGSHHNFTGLAKQRCPRRPEKLGVPAAGVPCQAVGGQISQRT